MDTPGDRLRKLRLQKGYLNAVEAARAFGWNENTYKSHENGERGIKPSIAQKYAAAFGSTPGYILGISSSRELPNFAGEVAHVPVIGRVNAGAFRFEEADQFEGVLVPVAPRNDLPVSQQYSLLVDGPSVNKRIPDQGYAICLPYELFPGGAKHGQLAHVVRERSGLVEHTIKEFRFTRDGVMLMPASTDPRYTDPVKLASGDDGDIVRIQGIVIGAYIPI